MSFNESTKNSSNKDPLGFASALAFDLFEGVLPPVFFAVAALEDFLAVVARFDFAFAIMFGFNNDHWKS
jgi:hypothetical protein